MIAASTGVSRGYVVTYETAMSAAKTMQAYATISSAGKSKRYCTVEGSVVCSTATAPGGAIRTREGAA